MTGVSDNHQTASCTWGDEVLTYRGDRKTLRQVAFGNVDPADELLVMDHFDIPLKSPFATSSFDSFMRMYVDYQTLPTFVEFCALYQIKLTGKQLGPLLPKWISDRTCPMCRRALLLRFNTRANIIGAGRTDPFHCPLCPFTESADGIHPYSCYCQTCNTPGTDSERQRWLQRKAVRDIAESQCAARPSHDRDGDIERENLALKTALALVLPESGKAFADLLQGYVYDKMRGEDVKTLIALLDRKITLSEAEAALGVKRL